MKICAFTSGLYSKLWDYIAFLKSHPRPHIVLLFLFFEQTFILDLEEKQTGSIYSISLQIIF